jgi:hypothetical protein
VINACYKPFSGALRLIDAEAGATCSSKERPLAWNVQGEKGEKGDPGPAGPQGVPGPAGTSSPPAAYESFGSGVNLPTDGALATVAAKRLPPGAYHVVAAGTIGSTGLAAGACFLRVQGGILAEQRIWRADGNTGVTLVGLVEIEGSSDPLAPRPLLDVACQAFPVASTGPSQASSFVVTAIAVTAST